MSVVGVLQMNGGEGATSYAQNSWIQQQALLLTKPVREEAIRKTCDNFSSSKSIVVADLGCSSGPAAFSVIHEMIQTIDNMFEASLISAAVDKGYPSPNLHFYLNDLPRNDFNTIFRTLSSFQKRLKLERKSDELGKCFIYGVPGSFYARLFEDQSLHFVHSSYSVHWLSKIPEGLRNKNSIYISRKSSPNVIKAYYQQFQSDFWTFLKFRSEELVEGGRMVLTLVGKDRNQFEDGVGYVYNLLARALNQMVSEGSIDKEKMKLFDIPVYHPSVKEIINEVTKEGSFAINRLEVSKVNWNPPILHPTIINANLNNNEMKGTEDTVNDQGNNTTTPYSAQSDGGVIPLVRCMRSVMEPLLKNHFGEDIVEEVFRRYNDIVSDIIAIEKHSFVTITVSLIKK